MNLGFVSVIDCDSPYDVVTIPGTTIITPNYPEYYGDDLYCQVTLTFEDRVNIRFQDFSVGSYRDCIDDWLEVHDGDNPDSDCIGEKRCNDAIPSPIESSGNSLTLVFQSNNKFVFYTEKGFKILADQGTLYYTTVKNEQIVN